MAGLNIPGVTDQYNTNETVQKLMEIEKIPLTREQKQLDSYKLQQNAWREINSQLTSLRESTKTLYSYENPFNNKITTSTDENAITAEANRGADFQSFKIDVIQPATADRFLSAELESDYQIPAGMYTYKVGEKSVNINWKGGSVKSFSDAINKRSNGVVKSMVIGSSQGKKTFLIESLITGKENHLIFEGDSKTLSEKIGMISPVKSETITFGTNLNDLSQAKVQDSENSRMPRLSVTSVTTDGSKITIPPRGAFQANLPKNVESLAKENPNLHLAFTIKYTETEDITKAINEAPAGPDIPAAGIAEYEDIIIKNNMSETTLPAQNEKPEPVNPVSTNRVLFAVMNDGSEKEIEIPFPANDFENKIDIVLSDYENLRGIALKNTNTGRIYEISGIEAYDPSQDKGYTPNHAITQAGDAIIKYEGITITRPTNEIDDVIPEITLNLHEKTEKTATITVKPDSEASKNALIDFVGKYNQAVAKINILSQNKSELIDELDYLTDDEKSKAREELGIFNTEFSLTSIKSNMANIISQGYSFEDDATITMLSQIGISTNASGPSGTYSQSRLRGYLEIDEKKLDSSLENHLEEIKNIFGYDTDGDLIIDSGIAYQLDKQIGAYTQTGGILAMKTSSLDSKIKTSESTISKLQASLDDKEAELKSKYSTMTGSLNSLESQQNTISNFTKQNQNGN